MRNIEEYAADYMKIPFEQYQVKYRRRKEIELLKKYPHGRILEVGCGMEPLFFYFEDFEEMTIVEPAAAFVNNVIKSSKLSEKIRVKQGFLEDVVEELKQYEYDYIIMASLLHEVEKPVSLLRAVMTLCSKQTIVHINVPNAFSLHRILAYKMGMITDVHEKSGMQKHMQQNSTFDLTSLVALINQACEVEIVEKGSFFPKFFTHNQMQNMIDVGIIDEKVLEGMYEMGDYFPKYGSEIYVNIRRCI